MDLASLVGVVAGVGLVLASILMNSGLDLFINIPSAMIVLGGTLAATLIAFPINEVMKVMGLFLRVFMVRKSDQYQLIETMVNVCNVARKGGVLAIESKLKEIDNEFLKKGLEMTVRMKPPLMLCSKGKSNNFRMRTRMAGRFLTRWEHLLLHSAWLEPLLD